MEFRILGPLEVYDASGSRLQPPAGRERALLVALLLRRGEVVSVDALIDAVWGERPPPTAAKAVQGYVSHLRRVLGSGSGEALVTRAPGYVLSVSETQVDAARFERLAADGQRALEDRDPQGALALLDSALSLWRGPALTEFAFDDFAQREIQRLTERQLEASEDRVEALLQLGRHGGLVSELEALVAAHPLRERLRGQLMLALYRSGRPADALHVYKEGARLSRELGLDPAGVLKSLERAILDQDPAIAAPPRVSARSEPALALPVGTLTLLSSDIVGSTELLRNVGAELWDEVLTRHRSLMRTAFEAHGGSEVDTQGDAFFAAFARAGDAVAAAVSVQRAHLEEEWPGGAQVGVRIGLHTGSPTPGAERYVGLDVHRVARVASAAHGGEILCTASTAALADPDERENVGFVPLGEFKLKDFPRPERLLRVVADGLPDSFPPPAAEPVEPPRALRRRRVATLVAIATVAALALLGVAVDRARDTPSAVAVVPPAVAVVDPETNQVVASIPVGSKPVTVTTGDGAVWVGDARDLTVTRIDPETLKTKPIGVGAPAVDVAASEGSVWVATGGFGTVVRIDSELDSVAERIELGDPRDPITHAATAVAAGGGSVWVGAFDGLVRIDPQSGEITDRVDLGQTPALQMAVGGGAVWATTFSSRAMRVEAQSAQVTAEFYAGTFVFPIALDKSAVWVGADAGQLWKIDPVTGSTQLTANAGAFVEGIALADDAVWVALRDEGMLVRVDPTTGEVKARIPIGGIVGEVAVAEGLVWVTVQEVPD